jgi:hypothetical protein
MEERDSRNLSIYLFSDSNSAMLYSEDKRNSILYQDKQQNSSFRVENRRARPKIVKNVNNICNIFIFQNNNQSNTNSQKVSQER